MANSHVGDFGHDLVLTVKQDGAVKDLSTFTVGRAIRIRKPDATRTEVELESTAPFVTDGTDGQISHTWANGEIDTAGVWVVQVIAESATAKFHSTWGKFSIDRNI